MKRIVNIFLIFIFVLILVSCTSEITYKVVFDSDGGTLVETQKVKEGDKAVKPDNPTLDGYNFLYWYKEDDSSNGYQFDSPVTESFTLYALWGLEDDTYFEVSFDSKGGSSVEPISVVEGGKVQKPSNPTKEGYDFLYWYKDNENTPFNFDTTIIDGDITLNALWEDQVAVVTPEEKVAADLSAIANDFYIGNHELYFPTRGPVYNSTVTFDYDSKYITKEGFIIPLVNGDEEHDVLVTMTVRSGLVSDQKEFMVTVKKQEEVVLTKHREVPFENLTTEYDVEDGTLTLYYEENGFVPYVGVVDFLNLLEGFIDPVYEFDVEEDEDLLTIAYIYYDDEEDKEYNLSVEINSEDNTIFTPDPGFYWAYVSTTETNYGRNIEYDRDNPGTYYKEGHDLVYNLNDYNMDIVYHDDKVMLPYYLANQLFAGSSYYNVYYNYDGLYGIYSFPDNGEKEYKTIRTSSVNNQAVPTDLLLHTFNYLAFSLDYFYGLKDIMEVDTYYDLLFNERDTLLNKTPNKLDSGIGDLLVKKLDEPHTSYDFAGYYNRASYSGPSYGFLGAYGPRFQSWYNEGLYGVDDALAAKWGKPSSGWSANNPDRKLYWFLDNEKTSAVLSLDSFRTVDLVESKTWNKEEINRIFEFDSNVDFLPEMNEGNKYFTMNLSTKTKNTLQVLVKGVNQNDFTSYENSLELISDYDNELEVYTFEYEEKLYGVEVSYDNAYKALVILVNEYELDKKVLNNDLDVFDVILSDSAIYMEFMLEKISNEAPNLENIVLDITWNTGGNVGALYRVVGFITDEPFRVSNIDGDTNSESISYVKINHENYYNHLNWALLTSKASFSAANSLAIVFKDNNLGPVIGVSTGGGASSITPILLPNGTAFTMSSNSIRAYIEETGDEDNPYILHSSEFGVSPDYELATKDLYDNELILYALNDYLN